MTVVHEPPITLESQAATRLRWWAHQRAWLEDDSRFRLCLKGRQCGMSTAVAAEAVGHAVSGKTTVLASASERQSRELTRRCRKLLPIVAAASNGSIHVEKETADGLELSTGGRIISVPASAATVQGFAASVVLDEAAWMPNADELWQALVPSITASREHRLSVPSTPRGKGGLFHRLWTQADGTRWSRHRPTTAACHARPGSDSGGQVTRNHPRTGSIASRVPPGDSHEF